MKTDTFKFGHPFASSVAAGRLACTLLCLGVMLSAIRALAQETCPDGPGNHYLMEWEKVDNGNFPLCKCGFDELTTPPDAPMQHVYLTMLRHFQNSYTNAWSSTTTTQYNDGGFSYIVNGKHSEGHYHYGTSLDAQDIWDGAPNCNQTNTVSGSYYLDYQNEDSGDTNSTENPMWGGCNIYSENCQGYYYNAGSAHSGTSMSVQWTDMGDGPGWLLVGTYSDSGSSTIVGHCGSGCLSNGMYSSSTSYPYTLPAGVPLALGSPVTELTTVHEKWVEGPDENPPETASLTLDLTDEYTDDRLRDNILARLPAYTGDWPSDPDPIAYSIIGDGHKCGVIGKMRYHLGLPAPTTTNTYTFNWEEVYITLPE